MKIMITALNSIFQLTIVVHVVMPALMKLRQENHTFKTNLGYMTKPHCKPNITLTEFFFGLPKFSFLANTALYPGLKDFYYNRFFFQ